MTTTATAPRESLARQFAAQSAAGVVPAMTAAVRNGKRWGMLVLALVLLVTYPHMGSFLASLPPVGVIGWAIPGVFDVGMLAMAQVAQTPGMHPEAKRRAMRVLAVLTAGSAIINASAPGMLGVKILFAFIVIVGLLVKWAVSSIRPDFAAMEAAETEAAEVLAPAPAAPAAPGRKCEAGCTCGKHRAKATAAKTPARKARAPRKATQPVVEPTPALAAALMPQDDADAFVRTLAEIQALDEAAKPAN